MPIRRSTPTRVHLRAAAPSLPQHLERLGTLAIVVLAILGGAAVMLNQFTLDDVAIIQENARLRSVAAVLNALVEPYWPPPFNPDLYRPVTILLLPIQRGLAAARKSWSALDRSRCTRSPA